MPTCTGVNSIARELNWLFKRGVFPTAKWTNRIHDLHPAASDASRSPRANCNWAIQDSNL